MDAEELSSTIADCKNQIRSVDEALQNAQPEEEDQLRKLKADLIELIELTESQLLDVKKSELLGRLNETAEPTSDELSNELNSSAEHGEEMEEYLEEIVGIKCRAPFDLGRHLPSYHNAVIMEIGDGNNHTVEDVTKLPVKVLFCSPMSRKMQPCRFFLDNKCNFDNCKFSHGETVAFEQLMEFEEIDYKSLAEGSMCLAKSETTDLWEQARITSISNDENQVAVTLLGTGFEKAVDFGEIVPLISSIEEESPRENEKYPNAASSSKQQSEEPECSKSETPTTLYGDWEKHTKGFGSKLLQKMGYVEGQGLGKLGAGITEPVKARLFPKGKSLDFCMRKKELAASRRKMDVKNLTTPRSGGSISKNMSIETGIFDFINNKLRNTIETKSSRISSSQKDLSNSSDTAINVKLMKIQDSKKKYRVEISRLKTSLTRNEKKDVVAAARIREKLNNTEERLRSLSKQEKMLNNERNNKNDKKKLCIF